MTTPATERFSYIADLMKARLEAWPALQGAPAIVDRQLDIVADVAEAVAKSAGLALTILFEGFSNANLDADSMSPSLRYTVRAWGLPVVAETDGGFVPAETACIEAAKALHGWCPEGEPADLFARIEVARADLEPDRQFLIYALSVTIKRVIL
jgi:hypothetical protein